jgi:integrase/recombinase XerD
MKPNLPNDLGKSLVRFFQDYLPTLRGLSQHTIHGYRDAIVLFLRYLTEHTGRPIEQLNLNDLSADTVAQFLAFIEQKRGNSIATRNARLAALHTLARFLASDNPERLAQWQRVLALPLKRGAKQTPIEYLEEAEVKAVLGQIDRFTKAGQRDYAMFCLMFNTGARVQEILDLRRSDVRTDPPYQVRLKGKGAKIRLCPIWPQTAKLLRQLASTTPDDGNGESILFHNGRGGKLTRFGVRYLLHKYVAATAKDVETLRTKRIHPHSLRHGTAIALLKARVDFATISQWLGHSCLNTTMVYARADMDIKRQALAQVFPDILSASPFVEFALVEADLVKWLRRL